MPLDYNGKEIIHHGTKKSLPLSSMAIPHLINTIRLLSEDSPDAPIYAQELVRRYQSEEIKTKRRENAKAKLEAAQAELVKGLEKELAAKAKREQEALFKEQMEYEATREVTRTDSSTHAKYRLTINFSVLEANAKFLDDKAAKIVLNAISGLHYSLASEGIDFTRFNGTLDLLHWH